MDILRGDWRFFWTENLPYYSGSLSAWDASLNTGLGEPSLSTLWITSYLHASSLFHYLGFSWAQIGYFFWVFPSFLISFFSAVLLFRHLFPKQHSVSFLAGAIYVCNTYFLSLIGGGQLGVALSYSFFPLVIWSYLRLFKKPTLRASIVMGLTSSLQILFDPRLFFLNCISLMVLTFVFLRKIRLNMKSLLLVVVLPAVVITLLHAFWLLPLFLSQKTALPKDISTLESFKFFSFADFSHTLSLLHPNWPENIFGKTYFLQPQFLLIPLAAFTSFLFIDREKKKEYIVCLFFSLIGIFLAKGLNPPFQEINQFIFNFVPGMKLFRDPTKFYTLIALGYALLIPLTLASITRIWLHKKKGIVAKLPLIVFLIFWIILPFSTFYLGNPVTQFVPKKVPNEYNELKTFIFSQETFFRTLWIPAWQRYGYFSDIHPAIGKNEFFFDDKLNDPSSFTNSTTQRRLALAGVKYVILTPFGMGQSITEEEQRTNYNRIRQQLDHIQWLQKVKTFGHIVVYETAGFNDHFWSPSKNVSLHYNYIDSTRYTVTLKSAKKNDVLVFFERYDPNWVMIDNGRTVVSRRYHTYFNSFRLPRDGEYEVTIYYTPQKWVNVGLVISGISMIGILSLLHFIPNKPVYKYK